MASKQGFPGPLSFSRPGALPPAPVTSVPPNLAADYPGAPRPSDKGTLANVPPQTAYPGSGMPGEAWAPLPAQTSRRVRNG